MKLSLGTIETVIREAAADDWTNRAKDRHDDCTIGGIQIGYDRALMAIAKFIKDEAALEAGMADAEPEPLTYDEALGRKCDAEARYRRDMIDAGRSHLLGD